MKKLIYSIATVFLLGITSAAIAQSNFNYQGIARNGSGVAIANQNLGIRISILEGTAAGAVVYQETQSATTNAGGLFSLDVGAGTAVTGTFSTINWLSGPKFIHVEMDPAGGTAYVDLGTKKLNSVPFATQADYSNQVFLYGSGTANPFKMGISHSPAYPGYGLGYDDIEDKMVFTTDGGTTGVSVNLSARTISIPGGTPGVDKVLRSDAAGNASWEDFTTKISAFTPTGCQTLNAVTTTFQKISNLGTFTKANAASVIELDYQTNFKVTFAGVGGAIYQLRVDDVATTVGQAALMIRADNSNTSIPGTIHGVFKNLSAGTHTVSIWIKTINGTGTFASIDDGCFNSFNTNTVIVKESR